nr:hypothetical protein [Streptomyces sp. BHT-5-2]
MSRPQRLRGDAGGAVDHVAGEHHTASGAVGALVVVHLEPEGFEHPPPHEVGECGDLAAAGGQGINERWILSGRGLPLEFFGLCLFGGDLLVEFGDAQLYALDECRIESVRDLKGVELSVAAAGEVGFGVAQCLLPLGVASPLVLVGFGERGGQQLAAIGAEDALGEEVVEDVHEVCLADPQTLRVAFGHVTGLRRARVEAEVSAVLAEHAPSAEGAEEERSQGVCAAGLGVGRIGAGAGARALALFGHGLRVYEGLQGDERRVGGLRGPDPVLDRVVLASAGLAGAAIPHHVTGVLGVGQDVADVRRGPAADGFRRIGRNWRRVEVQSFVEPVGDRPAAEPLGDAPVEDLADDGGRDGVGEQAGLGLAFASAGWDGMWNAVGEIAVGWLADVVALDGVFLEASPCFLQHLQDVPLGYALLDAAGEDLGGLLGARSGEIDGFVGGQEGNACGFEAVLDECAEVRAAGDTFDGLADDRVEMPLGALCQSQQVLDSAVAGYWDVEAFVATAVTTSGQVLTAGFDVVVEADDDDALRQDALARAHLPRQRDRGVLLVLGRSAAEEDQTGQPGGAALPGSRSAAGSATWRDSSEESAGVRIRCCTIHVMTSTMTCLWRRRSASASSPLASSTSNTTSGAVVLRNRSGR